MHLPENDIVEVTKHPNEQKIKWENYDKISNQKYTFK